MPIRRFRRARADSYNAGDADEALREPSSRLLT